MTKISEICANCGQEWIQHWANPLARKRCCYQTVDSKEFSPTGRFNDPAEEVMRHGVTLFELKEARKDLENERTAHQHALLDLEEARKDIAGLEQANETIKRLRAEIQSGDEMYEAQHKKYEDCPHKPIANEYGNECGCSFDRIGDVCGLHSPALKAAQSTVAQQAATISDLGKALREVSYLYSFGGSTAWRNVESVLSNLPKEKTDVQVCRDKDGNESEAK